MQLSPLEHFAKDVKEGLSSKPKKLSSKYFYDAIGSQLFMDIMNSPEYYLTDAEMEIFTLQSDKIIDSLNLNDSSTYEIIELGAGDGSKTIHLLRALLKRELSFQYIPVDISSDAVDTLSTRMEKELPDLSIAPLVGDYFIKLKELSASPNPKVILFLGSNIGNMPDELAGQFIYDLGSELQAGDQVILGADLIKDKDIILPAYNDAGGITAAFNLNLLSRINRELKADFVLNQYAHTPQYDDSNGIARSSICSLKDQKVFIEAIGESFSFAKGEKIHTEISRKYDDSILNSILEITSFDIKAKITDAKGYFADYILLKS